MGQFHMYICPRDIEKTPKHLIVNSAEKFYEICYKFIQHLDRNEYYSMILSKNLLKDTSFYGYYKYITLVEIYKTALIYAEKYNLPFNKKEQDSINNEQIIEINLFAAHFGRIATIETFYRV